MKKILPYFLLLLFFAGFFGCKEEKKVKAIETVNNKTDSLINEMRFSKFDTIARIPADSMKCIRMQMAYERESLSEQEDLRRKFGVSPLVATPWQAASATALYRMTVAFGWGNPYGGTPLVITLRHTGNSCEAEMCEMKIEPADSASSCKDEVLYGKRLCIDTSAFNSISRILKEENFYSLNSFDFTGCNSKEISSYYIFEILENNKYWLVRRVKDDWLLCYRLQVAFYRASHYSNDALKDTKGFFQDKK